LSENRCVTDDVAVYGLSLNEEIIDKVKNEAMNLVKNLMKSDLVEAILYGSCARGDYSEDSDIDIALLTQCDRTEVKKYEEALAYISTELAMKYFTVVNFVCLPYQEFVEKRIWYAYFQNIETEGEVLYG